MDGMMGGMSDGSSTPLNTSGVDFSNQTQAFNFLQEILDDTYLQIDGGNVARIFQYGMVVAVGTAAICNAVSWLRLRSRYDIRTCQHILSQLTNVYVD